MTFGEELKLLLVDKVLIAGIAAVAWWAYSRRKEHLDRAQQRVDLAEREARGLRLESAVRLIDERISLLERKLDDFLWPLMLCMRKDDAIWQRVPDLYDDGSQLPTEAGVLVEKNVLLPNHRRAVELIERNFHLVAADDALMAPMIQYIRHVAVFQCLRESGSGLNPIDVDEPFPPELAGLIEQHLTAARRELLELRNRRATHVLTTTSQGV